MKNKQCYSATKEIIKNKYKHVYNTTRTTDSRKRQENNVFLMKEISNCIIIFYQYFIRQCFANQNYSHVYRQTCIGFIILFYKNIGKESTLNLESRIKKTRSKSGMSDQYIYILIE